MKAIPVNGILRPATLRQANGAAGTALAIGMSVAMLASPVAAQTADSEEVELDTLKIEGRTADVNPYTEEGAPYKARISGDSRRTKPLAETPQTITVITETQIEESGNTDLRDILRAQPGVTIGTGENGNAFGDRYIIRGQEMRSDVFVDGLRDPGMTVRESFAVEQVELTKGPSSTFAGRGSAGGAVNSITKQATTEYDFTNADAAIGTDNHVRLTADTNWKFGDSFAIRANLLYGYEEVPDRAPADRKRHGAAISALIRPADNFSVLFDYYHLTAKDMPDLGTYILPNGGKPVRNIPVYAQDQDFLKSDVDTFTARLKWEFAPGFRIENAARYGHTKNGYVVTGARGTTRSLLDPQSPGAADVTISTHQGWQEVEYLVNQLNLHGEFTLGGMKHLAILGGEISDHMVRNGVYNSALLSAPANRNCITGTSTTLNAYCIQDGSGNYIDNIDTLLGRQVEKLTWDSDWKVKTKSLYLMDTVDVTKWLTLFAGVRLDSFDYRNTLQNTTTLVQTRNDYSDTIWNYHAGISIKPVEDANIYFSYGTSSEINGGESDLGGNCGYGGICIVNNVTDVGDGKPERITNYELGAKWDMFGGKLMVTAAAFRFIKDDVFESGSADSYASVGTLNTGKHRVQGIEFGLVGNLTSRLSGQAGVTLMKSKILKSNDLDIPAATLLAFPDATNVGKRLANFANNQATAQLRYQLNDAFSFGGAMNYISKINTGQPDSAATYNYALGIYNFTVPAHTTFDLFATYKFSERFQARLNVKNVTNKDHYLAAYRSGAFTYIGDARAARLTLSAKF